MSIPKRAAVLLKLLESAALTFLSLAQHPHSSRCTAGFIFQAAAASAGLIASRYFAVAVLAHIAGEQLFAQPVSQLLHPFVGVAVDLLIALAEIIVIGLARFRIPAAVASDICRSIDAATGRYGKAAAKRASSV
ncbi:hypothetical protein D3C73_925860 [compost metagenome]